MKDFLAAIFGALNKAQLEHVSIATTLALIGVFVWVGTKGIKRVTNAIEGVRQDIKDTNARVDKTNKELADFKIEVAKEYVPQDQMDRRVGGLKEMIAILTDKFNDLQLDFVAVMAHLGITSARTPAKRKTTKKGK